MSRVAIGSVAAEMWRRGEERTEGLRASVVTCE